MEHIFSMLMEDILKFSIISCILSYIFTICIFHIPKHYKDKNQIMCWMFMWLLCIGVAILISTFS